MTSDEWIAAFAAEIGAEAPNEGEIAEILDLAAVAAHASERIAAPIACWMAGATGRPLAEMLDAARVLAGEGVSDV
jgi:hypothetical protein